MECLSAPHCWGFPCKKATRLGSDNNDICAGVEFGGTRKVLRSMILHCCGAFARTLVRPVASRILPRKISAFVFEKNSDQDLMVPCFPWFAPGGLSVGGKNHGRGCGPTRKVDVQPCRLAGLSPLSSLVKMTTCQLRKTMKTATQRTNRVMTIPRIGKILS
jgi:hypothetical protein